MCGRYTIVDTEQIVNEFRPDKVEADLGRSRYNVAPTQNVPALFYRDQERVLADFRWGLVPFWADDPSVGYRMINARAESVTSKPAYRKSFKTQRCLIPADGFFEWKKKGKQKTPMYVTLKSGKPFAFAGMYAVWHEGAEDELHSCTIITTDANELLQPIHGRMPVILKPEHYAQWMDSDFDNRQKLKAMLQPFDSDKLKVTPVSKVVNSPTNDDQRCIQPGDEGED
jgi:putative SOS response-associated peptidase YedK